MEVSKCFGVLVMVDALGVRGFSTQRCIDFLVLRKEIIDNSIQRWHSAASVHSTQFSNASEVMLHTLSFADTLILAVEMKGFSSKHGSTVFPTPDNDSNVLFYGMWLERLSYVLGDLIRDSLDAGILFRGAMSAGEFLVDKESNSILGPAINDAVSWYEAFDTFGVVLTPHASTIIDRLSLSRTPAKSLKSTLIPFSSGKEDRLYAVNWPNAYIRENYNKRNVAKAHKRFLTSLALLNKPIGTERKFATACMFFQSVVGLQKSGHV